MTKVIKVIHKSKEASCKPHCKLWKIARIVVLGDTHGQIGDVLWAFSKLGMPNERNVYVVNGDIAACQIGTFLCHGFAVDISERVAATCELLGQSYCILTVKSQACHDGFAVPSVSPLATSGRSLRLVHGDFCPLPHHHAAISQWHCCCDQSGQPWMCEHERFAMRWFSIRASRKVWIDLGSCFAQLVWATLFLAAAGQHYSRHGAHPPWRHWPRSWNSTGEPQGETQLLISNRKFKANGFHFRHLRIWINEGLGAGFKSTLNLSSFRGTGRICISYWLSAFSMH